MVVREEFYSARHGTSSDAAHKRCSASLRGDARTRIETTRVTIKETDRKLSRFEILNGIQCIRALAALVFRSRKNPSPLNHGNGGQDKQEHAIIEKTNLI